MALSQKTSEIAGLVKKYYKTNDSSLVDSISDDDLENAITEYSPYNIGNDLIARNLLDRLKNDRKEIKSNNKFWGNLIKSNIVKYAFIGLFAFFAWLFGWVTWLYNLF